MRLPTLYTFIIMSRYCENEQKYSFCILFMFQLILRTFCGLLLNSSMLYNKIKKKINSNFCDHRLVPIYSRFGQLNGFFLFFNLIGVAK